MAGVMNFWNLATEKRLLMASKSRAAQEKLAQLEKSSAPFDDQLVEAAKFAGTNVDYIGRYGVEGDTIEEQSNASSFHGREEWLLRWLLKKFQSPKEDIPRKSPMAWRLLIHVLRAIPVVTAARILQERKFPLILLQTLEEAKEAYGSNGVTGKKSSSGSTEEESSSKASRKRKRSGELVKNDSTSDNGLGDLQEAIFSVISYIRLSSTPKLEAIDDGRGAEFSAEAMRCVLRTTAEEAAKVLGLWLTLSRMLPDRNRICRLAGRTWLLCFKEMWEFHSRGMEDLVQFSLYSSQALISLLRTAKSEAGPNKDWAPVLEELVARNIMIPAKAANADNPELDLIGTLTRVSVITDSANAPLLFDIAIRSIQPHGARRRRPEDETWLQTVFNTLVEAMPPSRYDQNSKAIRDMLQSAIKHKVGFELNILRAIASKYSLSEGDTNWELLHTLILLDANVFLIPDGQKNLLQEVLTRITAASAEPSWQGLSSQVVSNVVLPLMSRSANARDLSGFIRHWYTELIDFERLQKEKGVSSPIFSAWEDDALQTQLSKLLEPSLTLRQITEILDFLEQRVEQHPDAVCVILEAIAGSITREEIADATQLRLYHIMFDNGRYKTLDARYKWRPWRIISRTLSWATNSQSEKIAALWEERVKQCDALSGGFKSTGLLKVREGQGVGLESLEAFRTGCAVWERVEEWSPMKKLIKAAILELLQGLAHDTKSLLQGLCSSKQLGEEVCSPNLNIRYRGVGWMVWSYLRCVFVEYPKALELGLDLPDSLLREILQDVFWIASASLPGVAPSHSKAWLSNNPNAFPDLWISALTNPGVQNNEALIEHMIDIMLLSETNIDNPLIKSLETNRFAVKSLLQVPIAVFSRKERTRIREAWLQPPKTHSEKNQKRKTSESGREDAQKASSYELTALNPEVLALKTRIMQLSTSHEGMKFDELVQLADALGNSKASVASPKVNLAEFKKLAELTLTHMTTNLDQTRSQEYVADAITYIRRLLPSEGSKVKGEPGGSFTSVALFQVVLTALLAKHAVLNRLGIITSDDLRGMTDSFKDSLLSRLKTLLKTPQKTPKADAKARVHLELLCIVDALTTFRADGIKLAALTDDVKSFIASMAGEDAELASRLETFMAVHGCGVDGEQFGVDLTGDTSIIFGRRGLLDKTNALVATMSQQEKLDLLKSMLVNDVIGTSRLDKVLAARYIIVSCKDVRGSLEDDDSDSSFDLSSTYSILCSQLRKSTSFRQFLLIGETMEMMLRTKGRAISQWNVDSTLGSTTIMCSRNGPSLPPTRAGNIYLRLCHLLQAVLTDHRLKLQGHFHLVVQCIQVLLRCLFIPLPHTSAKSAKLYAPPPWLSSPQHQLKAIHAATFTRLITSICDPSVSSVTRSQRNNLTSATEKAKRIAGQHMQFVLMTYIKLQLEMKMIPEVREKMIPGLYAIFDTTTPELRRLISESLDSSGRAVFGTLYRDYAKFGKWKGS